MLEIQKFIEGFKSIQAANSALVREKNIAVKEDSLCYKDGRKERVFLYNYDLILSDGKDAIVKECRGLILDATGNVVSLPFTRFFNAHESAAAIIDWNQAKAYKKYDGSMIAIYSCWGSTFIQTRGNVNAAGNIKYLPEITYGEAVKTFLKNRFGKKGELSDIFNPNFIYIFEFVAPYNRIVTPYYEPNMILLSIRNKRDLKELPDWIVNDVAKKIQFDRPDSFEVRSLEEVTRLLVDLPPTDEGFVVVDQNFNRLKVKNPRYLALSKAVNAGNQRSPKNFAEIVLNGDADEMIGFFPEYKEMIDLMVKTVGLIKNEIQYLWEAHENKNQKDFALSVLHHPYSEILFKLRYGKILSIEEGIRKARPEKLIDFVKSKFKKEFESFFKDPTGGME